jgi:hypothetical protein
VRICFLLLAVCFCTPIFSQTIQLERLWYPQRIAWADSFENIIPIRENVAIVSKNGLTALIKRDGKLITKYANYERYNHNELKVEDRFIFLLNDDSVIEFQGYDFVYRFNEQYWQVSRNDRKGIADSTGRLIIPMNFLSFHIESHQIVAQDTNGLYGQIDNRGNWLIKPSFWALRGLPNGLWTGQNKQGQCALLDASGLALTDYLFQDITSMCDTTFWATQSEKRALFTKSNTWINYSGKHLTFKHYDVRGNLLSDSSCQSIDIIDNGKAYKIVRNGRYEFWDACGKPILVGSSWEFETKLSNNSFYNRRFSNEENFPHYSPDALRFQKDNLMGLKFLNQGKDIPTKYRKICASPQGIVAMLPKGGTDWYDRKGNLLKTTKDSIVGSFPHENWTFSNTWVIENNGLKGIVDLEGNQIIPPKYNFIYHGGSGFFAYQNYHNERGLLSPYGEEIRAPLGCLVEKMCGNNILISKGPFQGLMNLKGRVLIQPTLEGFYPIDAFHFYFKENKLKGVLDASGKILLPAEYSEINKKDQYFNLKKNDLCGITNLNGEIIVPVKYTLTSQYDYRFLLENGKTYLFHPKTTQLEAVDWTWLGGGIIKQNGKVGLVEEQNYKTLLLPIKFDTIYRSQNYWVAKKNKKDYWYKANGKHKLVLIPETKIIQNLYWATIFEQNGKQGLFWQEGDTIRAQYDQIIPDLVRQRIMGFINNGICTIPEKVGEYPSREFKADSAKGLYNLNLLQYWHNKKPWLLNIKNGGIAPFELLDVRELDSQLNRSWLRPSQSRGYYVIKVLDSKKEKIYLVDSLLKNPLPENLELAYSQDLFPPLMQKDSAELFLVKQDKNIGLWRLIDKKMIFPCEYQEINMMMHSTGKQIAAGQMMRNEQLPTDYVILKKQNLHGIGRISDGSIVLPYIYTKLEYWKGDGLIWLYKDDKKGLYRLSDGKMIQPIYTSLGYEHSEKYIYAQDSENGYLSAAYNIDLDLIVPLEQQEQHTLGKYISARKDKLWAMFDLKGNQITPYIFEKIEKRINQNIFVAYMDGKATLLDSNLQAMSAYKYDHIEIEDPYDGITTEDKDFGLMKFTYYVPDSLLWQGFRSFSGLLDLKCREVLEAKYTEIDFCKSGVIFKEKYSDKYGVLRPDLSLLIPANYDEISGTIDGSFIVKKDKKYQILTAEGRNLIKDTFDFIISSQIQEEPYIVCKNNKNALMNRSGKLITEYKYEYTSSFSSRRVSVRVGNHWGYLDKLGQEIIPLKYIYADDFGDGGSFVAMVWSDTGRVQIDTYGQKNTEKEQSFSHRRRFFPYAPIDSAGLRDGSGRIVIPSDSLFIANPSGSICPFTSIQSGGKHKWGLINLNGKVILPPTYDDLKNYSLFDNFGTDLIPAKMNEKWGYINRQGVLIIPAIYDFSEQMNNKRPKLNNNGKIYWIDNSGKCVEDCE